ncbi:Clp protease N-terminal domain-containing protein [Mycobacterium marinum]|uniref:Clp protease N-terminal domain-containing protein n=1 Tax=Mycobacterium marinum TaxID=1781 RepID=UPI0021C3C5CD|nr:Clp protease N-terminal domain-containing protein [Mycobacterium marinum]
MFEVFDLAARAAVIRAHEEARCHGSHYIGTEHLLLGVLGSDQDRAVGQALEAVDVTLDAIRSRVEDSIGPACAPQPGHLPFRCRRARFALERTRVLSRANGDDSVGPTHVLAALMVDGESAAAQTVMGMGIPPAVLRERVLDSDTGESDTDN